MRLTKIILAGIRYSQRESSTGVNDKAPVNAHTTTITNIRIRIVIPKLSVVGIY